MANNNNLIPLTTEKAREIGRKGGKASVESRRNRKNLKEELLLMLAHEDVQKRLAVALIEKALSGNVKAFEVIRDTIGEKPKSIMDINDNDILINIIPRESE